MTEFNRVSEAILAALTTVVGPNNLSTAKAERQLRAQDMSQHEARLSEVVIWPSTGQQVADVLRIAHDNRIAVTPLAAFCSRWSG
jgi:FAD/FMN-containing dehydrogenase